MYFNKINSFNREKGFASHPAYDEGFLLQSGVGFVTSG